MMSGGNRRPPIEWLVKPLLDLSPVAWRFLSENLYTCTPALEGGNARGSKHSPYKYKETRLKNDKRIFS